MKTRSVILGMINLTTHDEKSLRDRVVLLTCGVLSDSSETINPNTYSDLFSSDKNKVTKIAKTLRNKFLNYQVHRKNGNNLPSAAPVVVNNPNTVNDDCGNMD